MSCYGPVGNSRTEKVVCLQETFYPNSYIILSDFPLNYFLTHQETLYSTETSVFLLKDPERDPVYRLNTLPQIFRPND
jgi:hypothetical protein